MAVAFEADGRGRPHIVASTVPSEMGTGPSSAVAEALDGWSHSVSHSGDVVVVAVAFGAQVGVDVEQAHPDRPWERLARRFFHPDETDRLLAMPVGEAETAFFELWTRKEATLKALGSGLSGRLDSVVPVDLRKRARDFPEPAGTVRWQVQRGVARFEGADVALSDDHRAAVAVAGSLGALDVRRPGDADGPYEALLRQPFKNSSTQR